MERNVHGSTLPRIDLERSHEMVSFFHEAAITALRSLGYAYGLPLDWTIFVKGAQTKK